MLNALQSIIIIISTYCSTYSTTCCVQYHTLSTTVCVRGTRSQKYPRRNNSRVLKKSEYARISKSVKYISKCVCDDVTYTMSHTHSGKRRECTVKYSLCYLLCNYLYIYNRKKNDIAYNRL